MLRKLLGTGLLLATLAGCTKLEGQTCTSNAQCGEGGLCDTAVGICYKAGTDICTPTCAVYEGCLQGECKAGFTEVKFLTPADNALVGGGTIEVSAQLEVDPNLADVVQPPDTLIFAATRDDGGDIGSFGTVTRNGYVYTVQWTAPGGQAQIRLTAAHPIAAANVPRGTRTVRVDTLPPDFTITFSSPPTRIAGDANQADQRDPTPGYEGAFRRDEPVLVTISANEPVNNVALTVVGIGPGGIPGQSQPSVAVQQEGTCAGAPTFCGAVTVNLSLPEMSAVRGNMEFQVVGQDTAGNSGSSTASLAVTRVKWAFDGLNPIKASPAVGDKGVVYFGTAATAGKVFAIEPSGRKRWEVDVETVEGSPSVGSSANGTEFVYVASNFSNTTESGVKLRAIASSMAGADVRITCTQSVNIGAAPRVVSAAAVTQTVGTTTPVETGLFMLTNYGSSIGLRPSTPGASTLECVPSLSSGRTMPSPIDNGSLVATDAAEFVYPTNTRRVVKYTFGNSAAAWVATPGGEGGQQVAGLAFLNDKIMGGGGNLFDQGGVFQVPYGASGTTVMDVLVGTENGRINQFIADENGRLFYGREFADNSNNPAMELARYDLAGPDVRSVLGVGVLQAAPVLGSDGRLYTINKDGELAAWLSADLTNQWRIPNLGANVGASPTIDCVRDMDGNPKGPNLPGVLYVAAGGILRAFVVDSPRLIKDSNSWPKFQHDARNTGNPATPITNCP